MLAIIGGTGVYSLEGLTVQEERVVPTPFGQPSAPFLLADYNGREVIFFARHGLDHHLLPHEINYRANIWALKSLGVFQVVAVSAVGSLRREIAPGDFAIPSQYVDFVRGSRGKTFFGGGLVAHVSTAEPVCPHLSDALARVGESLGLKMHRQVTYGCIDGPRLGTRAESLFLRDSGGCDLVGMTNVPEVFLAREAQICYSAVGIVTDYDCWLDDSREHVTVKEVLSRYDESIKQVKKLLKEFLRAPPAIDQGYRQTLKDAILSPEASLTPEKKELLALLKK